MDISVHGYFIPLVDNLNFMLCSRFPTKTDQRGHTAIPKRRKAFQTFDCLLKFLSMQGNVVRKFIQDPNRASILENASSHPSLFILSLFLTYDFIFTREGEERAS